MSWTLIILTGLVIGALQFGLRAPLWLRLTLVTVVIAGEATMIPTSVHGFEIFILMNWCYVIGVPVGLLFRSWKTEERFLGVRHADWVALAIASIVLKALYVNPQA